MGRIGLTVLVLSALVLFRGIVAASDAEPVKEPVKGPIQEYVASPVVSDRAAYDVVVIGSEIEGVYLARAAREEGLSVLILDPRDAPGGQLIQGEMQFLDEPRNDAGRSLLQGGMKELFDKYKRGEIRKPSEFRQYYDTLIAGIPIESGIELREIGIRQASSGSRRSVGAIVYATKEGARKTVTASYYVENTDYAALTSRLGLRRIPGIESIFGGGAKEYMAATYMMNFKHVDWGTFRREVMRLPSEARERKYGGYTTVTDSFTWGFGNVGRQYAPGSDEWMLRGLNIVNRRDGEAAINALLAFNVDPANPEDLRKALEEGRQETKRVLRHLRKTLPGWENAEIDGYPDYLYIRDGDRYETEYVLQGTDLMRGTMFADNVSVAGYSIDLQGTMERKWGLHKGKPDQYGMPLRAFLSKGYDNVVVTGKAVGASAVAYGSARIQPNTALAAETIGILLGRLKNGTKLIDLSPGQIAELQRYVERKYGISLTGTPGENKTAGFTEWEARTFDRGPLVG